MADHLQKGKTSKKDKELVTLETRYTDTGQRIASFESLYIITLKDDHWGVQARSSFAP